MGKREAAAALAEMAELIELSADNPFRARAYRAAARALEEYPGALESAADVNALAELPGIGSGLAAKIAALLADGTIPELEELRRLVPPGMRELTRVPGLGSKKARLLYESLRIGSLAELEEAARANRLVEIPGFGARTQENILEGLDRLKRYEGQWLLPDGQRAAEALLSVVAGLPGVARVAIAGEIRRWREVVGLVELVAASEEPESLARAIGEHPLAAAPLESAPARLTFKLASGIAATIHLVRPEGFAAALVTRTGSAAHVAALASRAEMSGLALRPDGLYRADAVVPCGHEAEIYRLIGLGWVPPECREGLDEVEAAARGELPELVVAGDLRGMIHVHSTWSDGRASILEMARAAAERGYRYLGLADHSRSAAYAGGLQLERVRGQRAEIQRLNSGASPIPILAGIESDILADGSLDYPDEVLAEFDFVIASVHSRFKMGREEMTARIVRAVASPYVSILAHPTGRLLLERDPYEVDQGELIAACARHRVAIEINASPHRLDLDWREIPRARRAGAVFAVNPDAHAPEEMDLVAYGLAIARKGGLTPREVLNTLDVAGARAFFQARRPLEPAG